VNGQISRAHRTDRGFERAGRFVLASLLGCAWACGAGPLERAALSSDLGGLKGAVKEAAERRGIDADEARRLARAVLRRELASRRSQGLEAEPIVTLRACTRPVESTLWTLASGSDDVAAEAAAWLYDAGLLPAHAERRIGAARHPLLEARRAIGVAAGPRRRAFMRHGDQRVRRAALMAAQASRDPADVAELLEVARLDPDPVSRLMSVEALGAIGGPRVVRRLGDAFERASASLRVAIVRAWASEASLGAGGAQRLVRVAESESGLSSVVAATVLLHVGIGPPALARGVLVRAISGDGVVRRLRAINDAPWSDPALRRAVREASHSAHPETSVLAWLRRASAGDVDAEGVKVLESFAGGDSEAVKLVALVALSRLGDESARAPLRQELSSAARAAQRSLAASGLLTLSDYAGASLALADDSPVVRRRVACALLQSPTGREPIATGGLEARPLSLLDARADP
jgi:hypothetical protein